jgi:hypothetical protein
MHSIYLPFHVQATVTLHVRHPTAPHGQRCPRPHFTRDVKKMTSWLDCTCLLPYHQLKSISCRPYIYIAIHALASINAIGPAPLRGGLKVAIHVRCRKHTLCIAKHSSTSYTALQSLNLDDSNCTPLAAILLF